MRDLIDLEWEVGFGGAPRRSILDYHRLPFYRLTPKLAIAEESLA